MSIPQDSLTDRLRTIQLKLADRTPEIFLSNKLLLEFYPIWIGKQITYDELYNTKYHDKTSHSDHQYAKRIKFWTKFPELSQFKEQQNLSWIPLHHRYIITFTLEHHLECNNSLWTIYNDFKCLTRILNIIDTDQLYLKYNTLMESLHNHLVEQEQWNRLSDKELHRMIDYETLQSLRDNLEQNWRQHMLSVGVKKSFTPLKL